MKIASLSKARKAKARAGEKAQADANAVKFGRTKAERVEAHAFTEKTRQDLDGHKRDTAP